MQRSLGDGKRFFRSVPTPATVLSVFALLFAMTGGAIAADRINRDEVTIVTAVGGPVDTTTPSDWTESFPPTAMPLTLNGSSFTSFTQKAGEVVVLSAKGDFDYAGDGLCAAALVVWASGPDELEAELAMDDKTEAGPNIHTDSATLAAPATDRVVTVMAGVGEFNPDQPTPEGEGCDESSPTPGPDEDTFSISLRLSITTLRN